MALMTQHSIDSLALSRSLRESTGRLLESLSVEERIHVLNAQREQSPLSNEPDNDSRADESLHLSRPGIVET